MTYPNGVRTESTRSPNASRAGALYSTLLYATPHQNRVACDSMHRHLGDAPIGARRELASPTMHALRSRRGGQ